MTLALDRPLSQADSLADDIRHYIGNLSPNIYDTERDYQEFLECEVILIDDRSQHYQIEIHDSGDIELLHYRYLPDGELEELGFTEITAFAQFLKAFLPDTVWAQIKDTAYSSDNYEQSLVRIAELAHLPVPSPGLPYIRVQALREFAIANLI